MRLRTTIPGVLILVLVIAPAAAAEGTIERSFEVASTGDFYLESEVGKITVSSWSRNEVEVQVHYDTPSGKDFEDLIDLEFDAGSDQVRVYARLRGGRSWWRGWFHSGLRLEFDVRVPRAYNLELSTSGGGIEVDDIDGRVEARTSGGSLRFGNIGGSVMGKTSGGSIKLTESRGDAELRTSGGGISVGWVEGSVLARTSGGSIQVGHSTGSVDAKTSGGGIQVDEVMGDVNASTSGGSIKARITEQPRGECRLSTSGGGIEVYLAADLSLDVDARSSGGRVKTDLPIEGRGEVSKNRLEGTLNQGGPTLILRTSGGSIRINSAGR